MEWSASSLNTLSKCSYKWYLMYVKGLKEPGKKSFNMFLGNVVGDAIQTCARQLNITKRLSDATVAEIVYEAWAERIRKASIPESLLAPIKRVLTEGESEDDMHLIDSLSITINMSEYEFKPPAPLKNGKPSMNKKKPPLCMKVVNSLEAVLWFFEDHHPHYRHIRDAATVEAEKWFTYEVGQPRAMTVNGLEYPEQDLSRMYYDLLLTMPDDQQYIYEFKYTNTPYTQDLANKMNQNLIYHQSKEGKAPVTLFDITERKYFTVNPDPDLLTLLDKRYKAAGLTVQNEIYIPACGTDPYTTKSMLCGFKNGGCEYGTCASEEEPLDE